MTRVRNFPTEPYTQCSKLLLQAAIGAAIAFAMTFSPGLEDHVPTFVDARWWIAAVAMIVAVFSQLLYERGRLV